MNRNEAYDLCCRYHGKRVRITDKQGNLHVGRITKVDTKRVWLMPDGNYGGYGIGFWWGYGGGYGYGYGFGGGGFGYGLLLGGIAGIALASIFI